MVGPEQLELSEQGRGEGDEVRVEIRGLEQGQEVDFTLMYLGRQWEEFNLGEGEDDKILFVL